VKLVGAIGQVHSACRAPAARAASSGEARRASYAPANSVDLRHDLPEYCGAFAQVLAGGHLGEETRKPATAALMAAVARCQYSWPA